MVNLANQSKGIHVKKIALALVAVSTLGLAACNSNSGTEAGNNSAAGNEVETMNQAEGDLGNASDDAANTSGDAQNSANNALDALGNAASDAGNVAGNAASSVGNAVGNVTE